MSSAKIEKKVVEVLVLLIGALLVIITIKAIFLFIIDEMGTRKAAERRRRDRMMFLSRLDFATVERRTGHPVPRSLREYYTSAPFLELDGFQFVGAPDLQGEEQFYGLDCFLPLDEKMLDQCQLPDPSWLPFALDERGAILFLPLSEFQQGDGPVYRIDLGPPPWKGEEEVGAMRRVSDSLRDVLMQGTEGGVRKYGKADRFRFRSA